MRLEHAERTLFARIIASRVNPWECSCIEPDGPNLASSSTRSGPDKRDMEERVRTVASLCRSGVNVLVCFVECLGKCSKNYGYLRRKHRATCQQAETQRNLCIGKRQCSEPG